MNSKLIRTNLYDDTNELYRERYELAVDRIMEFKNERNTGKFDEFFSSVAKLVELQDMALRLSLYDELKGLTYDELKSMNEAYYQDIAGKNYEISYANPDYAAKKTGKYFGRYISALVFMIRGLVYDAYAGNMWKLVLYYELVIEIHGILEGSDAKPAMLKNAIYYFKHDYCHELISFRQRKLRSPEYNEIISVIMNSDLAKPDYMYMYGAYVGDNELGVHKYLSKLSRDEIDKIADTFVSGYVRGFEAQGIDFSDRKNVEIRYRVGFERVIRSAVKKFETMGKSVIMCMEDTRVGTCSSSVNRQYEYDHRNDGIYFQTARYSEVYKEMYERVCRELKDEMAVYAGPAVFEAFGENEFKPQNKENALKPGKREKELDNRLTAAVSTIMRKYIDMTKRSFTIISYPVPSIGAEFEEIFKATNEVNTLDNSQYQQLQQRIIDCLDMGDYVHVKGSGNNKTDIIVRLHELNDSEKETNFENCTADVNIPVGEVFTTPVLKGTDGVLNVSHAFLEGYEYKDLELEFKDGRITGYSCSNFDSEEENNVYIEENILFRHDTLPIGEFAIGTNTTAYAMAGKFNIWDKLPILIAEKTGPHFAVGDTCYSYMEDVMTYNPDGKAIIARDNEVSILRKDGSEAAYLNCHTDITIPYDELDFIRVHINKRLTEEGMGQSFTEKAEKFKADNKEFISIIENGRFVVPGTEILNKPLAVGTKV